MPSLIAGVFLAIVGISCAAFPNGQLYPFDIDSLLTCHVDNPLAGLEGQSDTVPEEIPRLSFTQIVMQGDHPNVIWLPGKPEFRIPPGIPDTARLTNFLGEDFDATLTSATKPETRAPKGCEIVPSAEGSGGDQKVHISEDMDPTPFLSIPADIRFETFAPIRADPSKQGTEEIISLSFANLQETERILLREINPVPELCDIHTGLCPLNTTWAELPNGYFPPFLAQGTCSNKNCSFPRGKFCEEDFSYVSYVTVLRWDCCFDKFLGQIQWACGWRKVGVPLVCDCTCGCSEVYP